MNDVLSTTNQEFNERRYNRRYIDGYIRDEIKQNWDILCKIQHGVELLEEWLNTDHYPSKNARLEPLKQFNLTDLVTDVFVGIAYYQFPELFTSVTAQLAGRLGFSDKKPAIQTMAEIVAVLCNTDAFDIYKEDRKSSMMLQSRMPLSEKLLDFIENSEYLPPMVCEPNELTTNRSSGYLTNPSDSLILGSGNHHDNDICLDVLNIMNRNAYSLDTEFLSKYEENPTFKLVTPLQHDLWKHFKKVSYRFYTLMVDQGNKFYLTHKVDKRGRIYACGHHISTQGTGFKKSALNLFKEELVEGVP